MANEHDIQLLLAKIEALAQRQQLFADEINTLKQEVAQWQETDQTSAIQEPIIATETPKPVQAISEIVPTPISEPAGSKAEPTLHTDIVDNQEVKSFESRQKTSWERFIGENLLSKIGILVMIIGVFIGVKYSIEHNLISPVMRITLGYVTGIALLAVGIVLKSKYQNFSAVLVAGSLTMFYFITFFAYDFYGLFPQLLAFVLMFVFTIFAVIAALNYQRQIIATLGLVGSYAVPFLLSSGSGDTVTLFAYIAVINIGVAVISLFKEWRGMRLFSFFTTWIIFFSFYFFSFEESEQMLYTAFVSVSFLTFYASFVVYKMKSKTDVTAGNTFLILSNALLYYLACVLLHSDDYDDSYSRIALITLGNSLLHFAVAAGLHTKVPMLPKLKYVALVLAISFATLAIPIQFSDAWVTLFWATEAALLFWLGRSKNIRFFENISFSIVIIVFFNLLWQWEYMNSTYFIIPKEGAYVVPFAHGIFASGLYFSAALGFILWYHFRTSDSQQPKPFMTVLLSALLLCVTYFTFYNEIALLWNIRGEQIARANIDSQGLIYSDSSLSQKKFICLSIYSMIYVILLIWGNLVWIKKQALAIFTLIVSILASLSFLAITLYHISELRSDYIAGNAESFYFLFRYLSLGVFGLLLYSTYRLLRSQYITAGYRWVFELALHLAILWVASSELLHWTELFKNYSDYKLGLSILWGAYAVIMIVLGIYHRKKHLRIGAIALFSVTLIKLFVFDIVHLSTLSKTVVFVSIGAMLLLVSFLYNKYNKRIESDENFEK
ncbi:MAG: DUF2339 domain-containing protein [Capnocytophaga sp.]|nr:DUF2339 domain-containing protein [Capnocytophaga sp.]